MKHIRIATAASLMVLLPTQVFADFLVDGVSATSTEKGLMGYRSHYEQEGKAGFRKPNGDMKSQQKKYQKQKLYVDNAYRSVTHVGTGHAVVRNVHINNVQFDTALGILLPSGWQLYRDPALTNDALPEHINLSGGTPWVDQLKTIGDYHSLKFNVDWYDQVVVMSKGRDVAGYTSDKYRVIQRSTTEPAGTDEGCGYIYLDSGMCK